MKLRSLWPVGARRLVRCSSFSTVEDANADTIRVLRKLVWVNRMTFILCIVAVLLSGLRSWHRYQPREPSSPDGSQPLPLSSPPHDDPPASSYPLHPSHQEGWSQPYDLEPMKSIDAESLESRGESFPYRRRNTTELLASCLNSCIESPFLWTFKVDQEGREDTERNIKAHVNRGKVDTAKWVSRLGEKTRVNIENIRSSLMGEDRR